MTLISIGKMIFAALPILLKGAVLTLEISICGLVIGCSGGILLGALSSNKMKIKGIKPWITGFVALIRGTPLFVQLLVVYFALPTVFGFDISALSAGIFTLGVNSTAYVTEIIRGGVNATPSGQWEAAQTLGYSPFQTLTTIILPQALKKSLPSLTNQLVSLIKESSLLMILGVQELTKVSKEIVARELNPMEVYLSAALIYFILTTIVSSIAKKWEGGCHESH